jgi:predicted nucleic-acid-binding protein
VIAIDTNVLLRYLLQDDTSHSPKANKLIGGTQRVLVTDIAIIETIWTLKGKKYQLKKSQLLMVLDQLFKEPNIEFENGQTVWRALNDFRYTEPVEVGSKKKEASFSDALILQKSKFVCAQKEPCFDGLYTFDVTARQISGTKERE